MRLISYFIYALGAALGALVAWLPFRLKAVAAQAGAFLWFRLVRLRRRVILHNLAAAFPRRSEESMGAFQRRCEALAEQNLRHMLLLLLEVFERFHWTPETLTRKVRIHGLSHIRELQAKGQGFFFLTAHLGNWELISCVGCLVNIRLVILTKYLRSRWLDAAWVKSRERYGLELIPEERAGLPVARAVQKGKAVGFILDQHTGPPHGLQASFLGVTAWCPKGLAVLGQRLKAPILPAYMIRATDGTFDLHVQAPLPFDSRRSESDDAALAYHVRVCNENMEEWIRRAPEQYLWMHKRFKGSVDYSAPLPWQL